MKGTGELERTYEGYDEAFGDGSFNFSNPRVCETRERKERFELALSGGLVDHRISQQTITEK